MNEVQKLAKRLEEMKAVQFQVDVNHDYPDLTAEKLAAEINRALDLVEAGLAVELPDIEYGE